MNRYRTLTALLLVANVCNATFWVVFGAIYLGTQGNGQFTEANLAVESQDSEPVVDISSKGTTTSTDTGSKNVQLGQRVTTEAGGDQDGDDDDWTNLSPASLRWFPLKSRRGGKGGGNQEYGPFFAVPEYPLGAILGLAVCFAALAVFKSRHLWKTPR